MAVLGPQDGQQYLSVCTVRGQLALHSIGPTPSWNYASASTPLSRLRLLNWRSLAMSAARRLASAGPDTSPTLHGGGPSGPNSCRQTAGENRAREDVQGSVGSWFEEYSGQGDEGSKRELHVQISSHHELPGHCHGPSPPKTALPPALQTALDTACPSSSGTNPLRLTRTTRLRVRDQGATQFVCDIAGRPRPDRRICGDRHAVSAGLEPAIRA